MVQDNCGKESSLDGLKLVTMPETRDSFSMVTKLSSGFRGPNDRMSPGESLLQHVLDDPLLALARTGGKLVCHVRRTSVLASIIYRSKLSSSARRSFDGTTLE